MLTLKAQLRVEIGKKAKKNQQKGMVSAVLYGPGIKPQAIEAKLDDFKKVFKEAGESSLINLEIEKKKFLVLIYDVKHDPMNLAINHVDFYQPKLDKEVEATVPLIFEGVSPAVKDLEGTLIKEFQEIKVKALPQNLPHDIKVDISVLVNFESEIKIKDLMLPEGVRTVKEADEIVVLVAPPQKIEEELAKPIEEKVEDVEKVETKKEKADVAGEGASSSSEKK